VECCDLPVNVSRCSGSLCRCQSMAGVHPAGCSGGRLFGLFKRRDGQPWVMELKLILLLTDLLAITLTCQRFLHALLFTGLQIKRMTLDFLDYVFGLHLALEAPQGILKGFAFLYSNLCQEKYTSKQSQSGSFQNTPYFLTELQKL
jgi:hypothetical protein